MVNGSKNLELMLGSQRPYFHKTELGFEKEDDMKPAKNSQRKIPTFIYCFKKRHSFENAFLKEKQKDRR